MPELAVEVRNHVAHLTLNRPAQLNALSHAMVVGMSVLFEGWAADPAIKAIVVRGAGAKAFCAGGDIRALRESAVTGGELHHRFFIDEYSLDYQLHRYAKPFISVLDGIVMGGGLGISQGSGFRVVGPKTKMAMPETGIGLFPDVGGSYFLSRSPLGLYLGLTGVTIKAADALHAGLADRYASADGLVELDARLDRLLWTADAGHDIARLLDAIASQPPEPGPLAARQDAIARHFRTDRSVVEIVASLEGETREADAAWAAETAQLLRTRSPTLLEVTREQLRLGAGLQLADCFRMELGIVYHCFEHGDLMEGIRAVLVDKDNRPRWNPATFDDLDAATVAAFFAPRWHGSEHPLASLERRYG